MHKLYRAIKDIRHMRIVPKLILGYILFIVIPFILFGFFFYQQMYNNFLIQHLSNKEKFVDQALSNLEIEISMIESSHPLFQNNNYLIEYLSGKYRTDWEMIYYYLKGISTTFSFVTSSNPVINTATIYKFNKSVLNLLPYIVDVEDYQSPVALDEIMKLSPSEGMWSYSSNASDVLPSINFTRKVYNDFYTQQLGFLQINISNHFLDQAYATIPEESVWTSLIDFDGQVVYAEEDLGFSHEDIIKLAQGAPKAGVKSFYVRDNKYLVHIIGISKLQLTIIEISEVGHLFQLPSNKDWWIAGGFLIICILSFFYFTVAASISNRLVRFSRHLKNIENMKLAVYSGRSGTDEIGFLIRSYNTMIVRMDGLKKDIHRSALIKKETEIKILQAQIKPHFLYNTLETLRMMAFVKNEMELAEVASSLGKLLRYSLSKSNDEATFDEELEHVRNYIEIHRVRMGKRLQFEWDVQSDLSGLHTPRFILQPIVENSILHGLSKIRRVGKITLSIHEDHDTILIRISDNGGGIPEQRLSDIREILAGSTETRKIVSIGIGIQNVNERIKSYFGGNSGISVESKINEGATFTILLDNVRIPQNKFEKGEDEVEA